MNDGQTRIRLDEARFSRSWKQLGGRDASAFDVLVACYAEPQRAYHDAEHIAECLSWLERLVGLAARPHELAIALYFHDAVYDPERSDNEARSAELFATLADQGGVGPEARARVVELIELTREHTGRAGDPALICDIDLAILGAAPERYARFEQGIRQEYGFVGEAAYRLGRERVLRGYLERPCIYRTARMAAELEAQARSNLSSALAALQPKEA